MDDVTRTMPKEVAKDCSAVYDMFVMHGASPGEAKAKVCELYSPPRVTAQIDQMPNLNLCGGSTFDLRVDRFGNSWDFLKETDRRRCRAQIEKEKPYLVIGSPP